MPSAGTMMLPLTSNLRTYRPANECSKPTFRDGHKKAHVVTVWIPQLTIGTFVLRY
ncbi:hypothetical protein EYZ11_009005 [Aspergillus tanneri]|uniref:Uncharacterized protein n=1 Tax=Aspergillus tanneri TaxID=1220188 RepID=A0A4S3J9D2_9EURO|nr:hypothetical protein EYZ11_009005 [Aspergillus tanneri]